MPLRKAPDAQLDKAIGARLRDARRRKGLTQVEVSVALGIQSETVSRYESGSISLSLAMLGRMAKVLGVGVDELLGLRRADLKEAEAELLERWKRLGSDGRRVVMELLRLLDR